MRQLLAIEASHLAARRAAGRVVTDRYIELLMALTDAAGDYDCATDGAFHYSNPNTADARYDAARRAYDRAGAEFADYCRTINDSEVAR